MSEERRDGRPIRGGVTTVAGWLLIGLGVLTSLLTLGSSAQVVGRVPATWLPLPSSVLPDAILLDAMSIAVAGTGVLLIGFARPERIWEEELERDPTEYRPLRRRWPRALAGFALVVGILLVLSLVILPVPRPFQAVLPVGACAPGQEGPTQSVRLPAGTVLAFHWTSSDGQPVGEVWAPSGPPVTTIRNVSDAFFNSSAGYSVAVGNGTAIPFWACDFGPAPPDGRTVIVSGTVYGALL
jgi:hypothetical protein